jgi:tetratricopeptide (TPR) repeat protein
MSEYRLLLSKDPTNVDAMLNTGWVLMNMGDLAQAKATFEKALAAHPGHTYAMASLGNIHFVEGDYPTAADWYRKVLLQRPNHRQSIMALAKILERGGMTKEAKVFYRRLTELDPKDLDARLGLGWLQFSDREYEDALKTLEAAAEVDPSLPELSLYRGDILFALGKLPEAEAQYRQGLARAPRAPQGYHGLGLIAARRGDLPSARRFFEEALRANPAFAPAREELRRLTAAPPAGG